MYAAAHAHHAGAAGSHRGLPLRRAAAGGYTQVCEFHYLHNDAGRPALCRPGRDGAGAGARGAARGHRPDAAAHALHALGLRRDGPARGPAALRLHARFGAAHRARTVQRRPGDGAASPPASRCIRCARSTRRRCAKSAARARGRHAGPHPHRRAAAGGGRLPGAPRPAARSSGCWSKRRCDARWNLVHATHATPAELAGAAATRRLHRAVPQHRGQPGRRRVRPAGLAGRRAAAGRSARTAMSRAAGRRSCGCWNIRSAWPCASATSPRARPCARAAAAALFQGALEGGSAAAGLPLGGLAVGQRADFWWWTWSRPRCWACPPTICWMRWCSPAERRHCPGVRRRAAVMAGAAPVMAQGMREAMRSLWHWTSGCRPGKPAWQPSLRLELARRLAHRGLEHRGEGAVARVAAGGRHVAHRHAAGQHRQGMRQDRLLAPLLVARAQLFAKQARHGAFAGADFGGPLRQRRALRQARAAPLRTSARSRLSPACAGGSGTPSAWMSAWVISSSTRLAEQLLRALAGGGAASSAWISSRSRGETTITRQPLQPGGVTEASM